VDAVSAWNAHTGIQSAFINLIWSQGLLGPVSYAVVPGTSDEIAVTALDYVFTLTVSDASGQPLVSRITIKIPGMTCAADMVAFLSNPEPMGAGPGPVTPWAPPPCA